MRYPDYKLQAKITHFYGKTSPSLQWKRRKTAIFTFITQSRNLTIQLCRTGLSKLRSVQRGGRTGCCRVGSDCYCHTAALHTRHPNSSCQTDNCNKIVGKSTVDKAIQNVLSALLRKRTLFLALSPWTAGHPKQHKMYDTFQQNLFCPYLKSDNMQTFAQCTTCVEK